MTKEQLKNIIEEIGNPNMKSYSYKLVLNNKIIACGSAKEMRSLKKKHHGSFIWNSANNKNNTGEELKSDHSLYKAPTTVQENKKMININKIIEEEKNLYKNNKQELKNIIKENLKEIINENISKTGETPVHKTHYGFTKETNFKDSEDPKKAWMVTTMKRSNKNIMCIAQEGEIENGMFMFMPFTNKKFTLAESTSNRATPKEIETVHNRGVQEFINMMNVEQVDENPKVNPGHYAKPGDDLGAGDTPFADDDRYR